MGGLGGLGAVQTPQMKSQVEIFVGNIPVGTTQQGLVDFLNAAMLKVRKLNAVSNENNREQPPGFFSHVFVSIAPCSGMSSVPWCVPLCS